MRLIDSAGPCFLARFAFSVSPDSADTKWTYKISTENAPKEFQLGSEHLICRAAERRCTTTERLNQKPIVIWKTVWVSVFVINRNFFWRDTDRMKPASQRL